MLAHQNLSEADSHAGISGSSTLRDSDSFSPTTVGAAGGCAIVSAKDSLRQLHLLAPRPPEELASQAQHLRSGSLVLALAQQLLQLS